MKIGLTGKLDRRIGLALLLIGAAAVSICVLGQYPIGRALIQRVTVGPRGPIESVSPPPGVTVTTHDGSVRIGMAVRLYPLLEPGDDLDELENAALWIDGEWWESDFANIVIILFDTVLYDEDCDIVARAPAEVSGGWWVPLTPGWHRAVVHLWSTSGKKNFWYTWRFKVTYGE